MKKEYMKPDMEVVDIKMNQQLLAGSGLGTDPDPIDPGSSDAPELPGMPDFGPSIPGASSFPWDL